MYTNKQSDTILSEQAVTLRQKKLARKKAFGLFEASKRIQACNDERHWVCCGIEFSIPKSMHTHVAKQHGADINDKVESLLHNPKLLTRRHEDLKTEHLPKKASKKYDKNHTFPWLPSEENINQKIISAEVKGYQVLLFYNYYDLENPEDICNWQHELCERLQLNGKIRIAKEGINGTVGGSVAATELYIDALLMHPAFPNLQREDFKLSKGSGNDFSQGLTVKICNEIVQMGIDPLDISHIDGGHHISPSEFHEELQKTQDSSNSNTVFIDCRNYYESKIGRFDGALTPDIRKFSYWPEYVDRNLSLFKDKDVVMYCTGGIRCERGSAYLRSKGVCKNVKQLKGGIHRYIEQYPDGLFKGKLFVFDDRYTISTNDSVVAECSYCSKPYDQYKPCTTDHCHQLVLSCDQCRLLNKTACCEMCQEKATRQGGRIKMVEECTCTKMRMRIPAQINVS